MRIFHQPSWEQWRILKALMKTMKSLTEFNQLIKHLWWKSSRKKAYMMKIQLEENHKLPPILSEPSTILLLNIHERHQLQSRVKKKRRRRRKENLKSSMLLTRTDTSSRPKSGITKLKHLKEGFQNFFNENFSRNKARSSVIVQRARGE